jgi:hypothetical protein
MVETDAAGHPIQVDDLDADWLLALAQDAESQARAAERRKLRYAAQWCVLHPATADTGPATWSEAGERDCDELIGGDGTPAVAAFAAEAFAAALEISTATAIQLMADSLNLQHRLPLIWRRVEALEIAPWRARRIAAATASLSKRVAAHVDRELASRAGSCGVVTIERAIAQAVAELDPEAQAERERKARRTWGVRLSHGRGLDYAGTAWLDATGDTDDLSRFHDLVCQFAARLQELGDDGDLDLRKARALGVIADSYGTGVIAPGAGRTRLHLHLTLSDLDKSSSGVGEVERFGPATTAKIKEWVGHSRVSIRPVLDLSRTDGVDEHDPPAWMRELVVLRDRHCVFPWCDRDSRSCDLDHIDAYEEHGPPGQTRPDNLAPLCRRHHRAKTARRWRYQRHPDGSYLWHGPHGTAYAVTRNGTLTLQHH